MYKNYKGDKSLFQNADSFLLKVSNLMIATVGSKK